MPAEDCNNAASIEVTGPGGIGAKVRGTRMSDIIAVLSTIALGILSYAVFMMYGTMLSVGGAIRDLAAAQRELACIISRPQEDREREYGSPNSFCKQMGRLP